MKKAELTYIIDDDNIFVFVLKKLLEKNENFVQVKDFKNGEDVLDILEKNSEFPDIILLDINMPVVDGWQFLQKLEELPNKEKLKVFVMSSSIDVADVEKSKEFTTVKNYISKPINQEKLNELLSLL
ncbi:response regulator [Flavobacterium terrae]|uniref:Response regulator receiver domain-containing protein n=1 Tax=Flavobacterium terrae TaxID=415425 RepID=A0A1M6CIT6_9FLAO|nr:response regulator [Flavobacterium terrae]SHI60899.1 Response regulator receiver domain-containing protein [Flavobacterium terrae]